MYVYIYIYIYIPSPALLTLEGRRLRPGPAKTSAGAAGSIYRQRQTPPNPRQSTAQFALVVVGVRPPTRAN